MWVPSCTHSLLTTGAREGVVVTRRSQSQAFSTETLRASCSVIVCANFSACREFRLQHLISLISSSWEIARYCASACLPVPINPRTISFLGDRYFAATAPAAPVRKSVSFVALIIATGVPVAISRIIVSAITVGRPRAGLPGCTLTTFTPASESDGRYAGIVRKSPSGRVIYTFGGIWTTPLP